MTRKKLTTKDLILIAMFAALTVVLAQITIPLPFTPVPITLTPLAFLIAGALLGPYKGGLSILIYVLLGMTGLPVFAGFSGGIGILFGPTGGYIIGFILGAMIVGFLMYLFPRKIGGYIIAMIIGTIACYTLGTIWFMISLDRKLLESLFLCVIPYIPGDILKIIVGALLSSRLYTKLV